MTTPIDPMERRLPATITDLAAARTPDYLIDILGQTARTRQRPAWAFPGRWFPMADLARRPAFMPRLPMRTIVLALVLVAVLVAAAALVVGSQRRPPAPFGPAKNGLVAYANGGSVYTVDPASGTVKTVFTGDGTALNPGFSPDGTRLLFERAGLSTGSLLMSADADGQNVVQLTPEPLLGVDLYETSPDGQSVVIRHFVAGAPVFSVVSSRGGSLRTLDLPVIAETTSYRPGTSDLLFLATAPADATGIYVVKDDGSDLRHVLTTKAERNVFGNPQWSPDGSLIAYAINEPNKGPMRVHVMSADGTGDRVVGHVAGATFEAWPMWSPDGKRLLIERALDSPARPIVVSVDGGSPDLVIDYVVPDWGLMKAWSPDGRFIQVTPEDGNGGALQQVLWDTTTGASRTAPWAATSPPTWQRVAP